MEKRILVGSIIAVVILVLVSFTGVVGYQTTKSSTIAKESPLFSIRSKRAIDKESKDVTSNYVGKGEEINIPIPKRNERGELVQKIINMISKMDEKAFNRFIEFIISHMKQNGHTDIDNSEIIITLNQLRTNQEAKGVLLANSDNPRLYTERTDCTFANWRPACFLIYLLVTPFLIMLVLAAMLYWQFSMKVGCLSSVLTHCDTCYMCN